MVVCRRKLDIKPRNDNTIKILQMESSTSSQLFVYSSLRKGFREKAYHYLTRFFHFEGLARVKGTLTDLEGLPVATPTTEDSFIKGELYKLKNEYDFSYVFAQLDDYEGIIPDVDEEVLYGREQTTVYMENGTITRGWIYWYNGDVDGRRKIPSGDVLEFLEFKRDLMQ